MDYLYSRQTSRVRPGNRLRATRQTELRRQIACQQAVFKRPGTGPLPGVSRDRFNLDWGIMDPSNDKVGKRQARIPINGVARGGNGIVFK